MNIFKRTAAVLMLVLTVSSFAADKLAVAEPVGKGGVQAGDIEALWGILESSIHSDEYRVISRASLKQMLTEIGLTNSSDLVNLNEKQRAQLGKVSGVKYILITEVSKFGSKLNCTLRIIDVSTGEIDQMRTANLRVSDLDELADRIEDTLDKLLADDKQMARSALLRPNIRLVVIPPFLEKDFTGQLEATLLNNGVALQNLQSVNNILERNNLGRLSSMEPKTYRKVGELLEVKNLIMPTITRFEVAETKYYVSETGARGAYYIGYFEGNVRVVETKSGNIVASIPFEVQIDFRQLKRSVTRDWTEKDYGKYMITAGMQQFVPELLKVKALK